MKTLYLKVEVPDDNPLLAVHLVTESEPVDSPIHAHKVKLSNNLYTNCLFTEIIPPTDEEIENMHYKVIHDDDLDDFGAGAKWLKSKIEQQ